jgi:hypothetical protein
MDPIFQILKPTKPACSPERYSHTTLTQIENCPRRWWLLNSQFDELQGSYFEPISPAALLGSIVHAALEKLSIEFTRAMQAGDATSIKAVRKRFPVRQIVQKERQKLLERAKRNARAETKSLESSISVDSCISLFKELVRRGYSDSALEFAAPARTVRDGSRKSPIKTASFTPTRFSSKMAVPCPAVLPEVALEVDDPPIRGKIDLVVTGSDGDTLLEYKTGETRPEHEAQSRLYALLWWAVTGRLAKERLLLYPSQEVIRLGALTQEDVEREALQTKERVEAARMEIESELPRARPNDERCRSCTVRQLCDNYWNSTETSGLRWGEEVLASVGKGNTSTEWRDMELDLHGAEWLPQGFVKRVNALTIADEVTQIVCKVPHRFAPEVENSFSRVRLLNVGVSREGPALRILWSAFSEVFWGNIEAPN